MRVGVRLRRGLREHQGVANQDVGSLKTAPGLLDQASLWFCGQVPGQPLQHEGAVFAGRAEHAIQRTRCGFRPIVNAEIGRS